MLLKDAIKKLSELEKENSTFPVRLDLQFFDTKELEIKYYDFGYETFPNPEKQPANANNEKIKEKKISFFKPRKFKNIK